MQTGTSNRTPLLKTVGSFMLSAQHTQINLFTLKLNDSRHLTIKLMKKLAKKRYQILLHLESQFISLAKPDIPFGVGQSRNDFWRNKNHLQFDHARSTLRMRHIGLHAEIVCK